MKYKYDIISIGDATLDTFLTLDDASVLCNINREECWLCLNYADKIPVASLDRTIGGNAANNAVGSARLGLKTAIYSVLGGDDTGEKVKRALSVEGVDERYLKMVKGQSSNFSVVLNFQQERTILVYHEKRKYKLPKMDSARWVYYTSMGKGFQTIQPDLIKYLKNNKCNLGFNPGTHQLKAGLKVLAPVLKMTTVLIVNKEEAKTLTGTNNAKDREGVKDLLKKVWTLGPSMVVITDGANGSYSFDGKTYQYIGILNVPVLQRTGAGDAFSTGCLAALIHGKSLREAMRWGTANSASVIQKMGPQAGLLKKSEMARMLRENPKCDCEVI